MIFLLAFWFFGAQPSFDAALRSGLLALSSNDYSAAQQQLEAATKLQPGSSQAWLALAETYLRLNKLSESESAAARSRHLAPSDPVIGQGLAVYRSERARTEASSGRIEDAVQDYRASIELNPRVEETYFHLAQLYLQRQQFEPALKVLLAGSRIFDKSPQLSLATGVACYGLRRFPQAIDSFLLTIRLAPDVEQSYRFLGRMMDQAEGRLPEITAQLHSFSRQQPDNYLSSFLYAKALGLQNGNAGEREALLRRSISLNEAFWESHLELAAILEQRRDFGSAAAELERVIALSPKDPVPHYRLARLYDRLGKPDQASSERARHAQLAQEESASHSGMGAQPPVLK